mmetsp:Transcript_75493/g.214679  ORF Transcript_75493/g.214679 Transcript_75493/m.214679 type:complete len:126 (+) Transcript_75493:186-563(+)
MTSPFVHHRLDPADRQPVAVVQGRKAAMAEISAVEERLSIDEKPSLDNYESYVRQDGDQTPEAWQEDWHRMYRNFLWTDADVRARFERAEYFLLHNKEFGETLTSTHLKSKYKLWALRQQMCVPS